MSITITTTIEKSSILLRSGKKSQKKTKYSYTKGFKILEQPVSQPDFIATTIAEFKKIALAEQAARLAYEKKQRDLKLAREAKKLEKTKGSRKELYEQLKSEFEKS